MRTEPELIAQPKVAVYPRQDAAEFAFTVQVGKDWATVRWRAHDDTTKVAQQLRDVVTWLEAR